jgi:hypothetical protein
VSPRVPKVLIAAVGLASVLLFAGVGAGLGAGLRTGLRTVSFDRVVSAVFADGRRQQPPIRSRQDLPSGPTMSSAKTVTIELDAPADFQTKTAQGLFVISAFQVGFFSGSSLVRAIEIPRESARLSGSTIQIDVPLISVTRQMDSGVSLRVRPLSTGSLGPWSASAGSVTLPVLDQQRFRAARRAGGAGGHREPRASRARQVTVADVEARAALKAALTPLLDRGLSLEQAVGSFARIQDVATAVVLTKKLDLSLSQLCKALQGSPTKSLAEALKAVKPSVDAQQEMKSVSNEARRLVRARQPGAPQ